MYQIKPPAHKLPLAEQAVPRPFAKSGLKPEDQIEQLVLMGERAGLFVAARFLRDVWDAAENPDETP